MSNYSCCGDDRFQVIEKAKKHILLKDWRLNKYEN